MRKPFVLEEGVKVVGPPGLALFLGEDDRPEAESDGPENGTTTAGCNMSNGFDHPAGRIFSRTYSRQYNLTSDADDD